MSSDKKVLLGVMTIIFAEFGVDQFMLGQTKKGVYSILLCLIYCIPVIGYVYGIIRFIGGILRGVKVLKMSDEEFAEYVKEGPDLLVFM